MLKVIYIAGYGRSGSTILDIALGHHPDTFGMGELATMCRHVWPQNEYCACGERIQGCSFWSPVMRKWLDMGIDPDLHAIMQRRIEPMIAPARSFAGTSLKTYLEETGILLAQAARQAGVSTLIDSSKMPGRGMALAMSPGIDLRVVHLIRDGRAVAHSMTRHMGVNVAKGRQKEIVSRPAYRTALRWRLYNHFTEQLGHMVGSARYVQVRYEDLVSDPATQLSRIGRCVELDYGGITDRIAAGEPISPVHQMAGSRIRMNDSLVLTGDTRWETEISPQNRARVIRTAGGQLRRYGYL